MGRFFIRGASTDENVLAFVAAHPGCTRSAIAHPRHGVAVHFHSGADGLNRAIDRLIAAGALRADQRREYTYSTDGTTTIKEFTGSIEVLYSSEYRLDAESRAAAS